VRILEKAAFAEIERQPARTPAGQPPGPFGFAQGRLAALLF